MVAGLGTLLFALSQGFFWAGFGRLLIGGSVAVAFVGLLKLSSSWFPKNIYAFVTGNALSIGLIGAVTAGPPLRLCIDIFAWRQVIGVTGVMTLVLGGVIWFVIRDFPQEKGYPGFTDKIPRAASFSAHRILQDHLKVFKYRNIWLLFVIPGGVAGCALTFSGLWGVPYLMAHYSLSPSKAAALTSVLRLAWAAGAPVFGWLSDHMAKRKPLYIAGIMVVAMGWSLILFRGSLSFFQLVMLLCITGFCSGCIIISFAFVMESVPLSLSGTAAGLTNMGVMMGPMLLQPFVGRILDYHWTGQMVEGVRAYSLDAYEYGFIPMMVWIILSTGLLFFTRETHCRQMA